MGPISFIINLMNTIKNYKYYFGLLVGLFVAVLVLAGVARVGGKEAVEIEWIRQFGSSAIDYNYGFGPAVDADGNVHTTGYTYGALPGQVNAGANDVFVRKYDATGNEVWTRQFGTLGQDYSFSQAVDADGNVYVTGYTDGALSGQTSAGSFDVFVRKYDADGNEVWTRQFGGASYDLGYAVSVDSSGVYVAGSTGGALPGQTSAGSLDMFVRKYDIDGNEVWTRQFGTASLDQGNGVSAGHSGVYVTGYTYGVFSGQTNAGNLDVFVRKYDVSGNEVWTRQFGSPAPDYNFGGFANRSGVYLAGYTAGALSGQTNAGNYDAYVRKYNSDGNEVWTRQFGTANADYGVGVSVDSSKVYVMGHTAGAFPGQTNAGNYDVFVRGYNAGGNEIWTRQFGSPTYDWGFGISADSSKLYAMGYTFGVLPGQTSAGSSDAFVVKFNLND